MVSNQTTRFRGKVPRSVLKTTAGNGRRCHNGTAVLLMSQWYYSAAVIICMNSNPIASLLFVIPNPNPIARKNRK